MKWVRFFKPVACIRQPLNHFEMFAGSGVILPRIQSMAKILSLRYLWEPWQASCLPFCGQPQEFSVDQLCLARDAAARENEPSSILEVS